MTQTQQLKMREFKIRVAVVPTVLEAKLVGTKVTYQTRTIHGYTLKDAKKRAGIQ